MSDRLEDASLESALATLPDWVGVGTAIHRKFRFTDFAAALDFAQRVGAHAAEVDHHPELLIGWGRCTVIWTSHDAGGITQRDIDAARATEALFASE